MKLNFALSSLALATFGWAAASAIPPGDLPEIGKPAPEIKAKAWLNHLGTDPNLAALRGQAVLIEFWATW